MVSAVVRHFKKTFRKSSSSYTPLSYTPKPLRTLAQRAQAMGGHWKAALTRYATSPDPTRLPEREVLHFDEHTITIYDGFDKAKYHFLCLPRIPFRLDADSPSDSSTSSSNGSGGAGGSDDIVHQESKPILSSAGGKLTLGGSPRDLNGRGAVPPHHLQNIDSLLRSPYAGVVLAALQKAAEKTVKKVQERMPSTPLRTPAGSSSQQTANCTWDVHVGFHAVPSMNTVHLHVISSDLVSDRLKRNKHYLSFHPHVGFWLPLEHLQALHRSGSKTLQHSNEHYERLLDGPLVPLHWRPDAKEPGSQSSETFSTMPKLKRYLEKRWMDEVRSKQASSAVSHGVAPSTVDGVAMKIAQGGPRLAQETGESVNPSKKRRAEESSDTQSETDSERMTNFKKS